jgi:hypothetical protein
VVASSRFNSFIATDCINSERSSGEFDASRKKFEVFANAWREPGNCAAFYGAAK